ncbi:MAG: glycosyltransferase [Prevotella sp.]|nr:glycosyltransferase [Prevotella sp.]
MKKTMNLGIVIPQLEKYGGAERYLIECIRYWQDRHNITLYASKISEQLLYEHNISSKVQRSLISSYFEGEHSMVLNSILLPKIWKSEIGEHEIYHTHLWPTHLIDLHPMIWFPHEPLRVLHDLRYEQNTENIGINVVKNIHIYPKYNYDKIGDNLFESYLDAINAMDGTSKPEKIVANSQYTAKYLEKVYGHKIKDVVHPGVNPETFANLPMDSNLFVTISQLWPHKRVNLLIEAISLTNGTQLFIIGSGPEKEKLEAIARDLGVKDRVFFLSGLTNFELRMVLARACAFLFSAINEPFGIVVLEAMAAARPVIAVNQGGYVEACNTESSFLLPPYPSAFAEKITLLQENPELAIKMGRAGREISRQYTWENAANKLEKIISNVWSRTINKVDELKTCDKNNSSLFGIQYYLWYGEGFGASHWNDDRETRVVTDKPMLGYYGSSKEQTIDNHLDLFEEMQLDYIVLNLHIDDDGVNPVELIGIQHVFDIAKIRETKLYFAIQLAIYTENVKEIEKVISMLRKIFVNNKNYLHVDGMPVLFVFWTGCYDSDLEMINNLKKITIGFINFAMGLRIPDTRKEEDLTFGLFKGFGQYSPLELSSRKNWLRVWKEAYISAQKLNFEYSFVTISPGYNDLSLSDTRRLNNKFRVIDREYGSVYEEGMRFIKTLKIAPNFIMITSFNEYHENTHIEPSLQNGRLYVEMTKKFIQDMKEKLL